MSRKDQPYYRRANALVAGLAVGLLSVPEIASAAPQFTVLHSFQNADDGGMPLAAVIADSSGALYGTTSKGGASGVGTVYKLSPTPQADGTWPLTVLYSFTGANTSGAYPSAGLVFDKSGVLYGAVPGYDATSGNVFSLAPPQNGQSVWQHTVLHHFDSTDGDPVLYGALIFDAQGSLFGTTYSGGTRKIGNIFKLSPPKSGEIGWQATELHRFTPGAGHFPYGSLVFDKSGALYGTTVKGPGAKGAGTVYRLAPTSPSGTTWQYTSLATFGTDKIPAGGMQSGLLVDPAGNLYGTASGSAYELSPPTASKKDWSYKALYQFADGNEGANPTDGAYAEGPLVLGNDGAYYGMTEFGGSWNFCPVLEDFSEGTGCGTIYRLSPPAAGGTTWTEKAIYRFTGGDDGAYPITGLIVKDGALYGTTPYGGQYGFGTVFKLVP